MPRKHYTPEQIIYSLREAEVLLSQGNTTAQAARHLGITEQTYYRWRKEYGPTNYAGLAIIVLSIILFILDLKLNLGGILSLAGIASLIIGFFMLIDTSAPFLQIAKSLIIGLSIAVSVFLIIVIRAVYKVHRKKPITGNIGMVGTIGIVIENLNPEGLIKTHGEIWKALSLDNKTIRKSSAVKIISIEGLLLHVKRIENTDQ